MSRGRPPLEDIRKHFEKITKVVEHGRRTPCQKCNYCRNDIVDLIDRLKDYLAKRKRLPTSLKQSLNLTTSKDKNNPSDLTSPEDFNMQSLDK